MTDGSDGHDFLSEEVCAHFPGLRAPPVDPAAWPVLRELPYESWQGYGPVSWLRMPRGG